MGVQDFNQGVLNAINRDQSESITQQVINWSRSLEFSGINIDLIYGLPLQKLETFNQTLDKTIEISPDRIAVYNFTYVPWIKPHQKLIKLEELPTPDVKMKILLMTIEKLTGAGYVYIDMDHFAKVDDELATARKNKTLHRNFHGYSTKAGCDLFGLGMSSISHFANNYVQNAKIFQEYYHALVHGQFATEVRYKMSFDDEIRKYVIMRLMCDLMLDLTKVEEKFQIRFEEYFKDSIEKLQPLLNDELIVQSGRTLIIPMQGRLFLRNITMCFDAYLPKFQEEKSLFSRTV